MIPEGTEVYRADAGQVTARGRRLEAADLDTALAGGLGRVLRDDEGVAMLGALLSGLAATEFERSRLDEVLQTRCKSPAFWQIGEALAEAYLISHEQCSFPWPMMRDLRNPDASPAGADLVGFHNAEAAVRFAFGEAKSSADPDRPPKVVRGRSGLIRQLESLRDERSKRDALVQYLGYRALGQEWESDFREAAKVYIADSSAVFLFGVLVRDVQPDRRDLATRAGRLASGCPESTRIGLLALYLPEGSLEELPDLWASIQERRRR